MSSENFPTTSALSEPGCVDIQYWKEKLALSKRFKSELCNLEDQLKVLFSYVHSIRPKDDNGNESVNQGQSTRSQEVEKIHDESFFQTQLLQLNLQKDILEAENRAMQQKILMLVQENKQFQRSIKDSEDEINRLILALRTANQQINSGRLNENRVESSGFQCFSLLNQEASLLREITKHHQNLFQLDKVDETEQLLVSKSDYEQMMNRVREFTDSEAFLRNENSELTEKLRKLTTEKDDLITSLECATITEHVLIESNEKLSGRVKDLEQALESSWKESKLKHEENLKLRENLSTTCEQLASLESATTESIHQITELKNREVTLNETIHSLEVLNEHLSSEIISLRNSLPKQVVEMEVDEKDTSNETLHDDSKEIAERTIQSNQDPRLEEGNRFLENLMKRVHRKELNESATQAPSSSLAKKSPARKNKNCRACNKPLVGITISCSGCGSSFHSNCWTAHSYSSLEATLLNPAAGRSSLCRDCVEK